MKKFIPILFISFFFIACNKEYPYLPTVKQVDIKKYSGSWYEIARYEHFFEKGCKNVIATYTIKEDGDLKVTNSCTMIESDEYKESTAVAYTIDNTNSKLKVSFFRPFYGDYWIIDLADDYSYAVVGTPNREYLWILAREKTISEETKKSLLDKLPDLGFDVNNFIWTIQE
jgi:apolipoprotein D and lipocalin family protein